jgi:hypothetical protein
MDVPQNQFLNTILSEASQIQKAKGHMFSLICGIQTQYKYKKYYEKQVTLSGGHTQRRSVRVKEGRR